MIRARPAPRSIRTQNQFRINGIGRRSLARGRQFRDEILSTVHARVCCDPNIVAQLEWLMLACGLVVGLEQRMPQTHVSVDPQVLRVRATELLELNESFQYLPVDGSTVHVENAHDTAHQFVLCIAPPEPSPVKSNALTGRDAKLPSRPDNPFRTCRVLRGEPGVCAHETSRMNKRATMDKANIKAPRARYDGGLSKCGSK